MTTDAFIDQAARIVNAYVQFNRIPAAEVPAFLQSVHITLRGLGTHEPATTGKPAVPIKKSIGDDYIICLEDGAKLTMLKRYLQTHFRMTPEEYRRKWDLPHDYPMVAPAYARLRSAFAKKIGLGRIATTPRRRSGK